MSRTTRYEIAKIDRQSGRLQVRRNDPRSWDDFQTIYNAFVRANRHTTEISRYHLDVLKPFTDVLVLYLDRRPVCAHLMLRDEKIRRVAGIWPASIRLADVRAANLMGSLNRWLHWYEMRMCKSEGMLVYDLGGTVSENLTKFKLSLGGSRVMQHEYILARTPARLAFRLFRFLQRMRTGKRPASATGAPPNRKREHGAMGLPEMVGD